MRTITALIIALIVGVCGAAAAQEKECIALTFDDGPDPATTPRLLGILREHGVLATFFVVGQNVRAFPDIVTRMASDGHQVGNHSWSHPIPFEALSESAVRSQFERTDEVLAITLGLGTRIIRVPGGSSSPAITAALRGRRVVGWDIDPRDYAKQNRNAKTVSDYVLTHARPGVIVLLHDIHPTTVDAMPSIIRGLTDRGHRFVTVDQLWSECAPRAEKKR
jgi:peptidoglycan/xylan/chitin deacetylase (PgdA/CDA1 family)